MLNELTVNLPGGPELKSLVEHYTCKEVPFRYMGTSFQFALSRSLFSSHDIDAGSRLLLKSIAGSGALETCRSILDIGCGVGVIGVSLARAAQEACGEEVSLIMEDRNALAVQFSHQNALNNGLTPEQFECRSRLAFESPDNRRFDLVASNIPAKAGLPVIEGMLKGAARSLTPEGRACIVIVKTLADDALEILTEAGYEILHNRKTPEYRIIHYRPTDHGELNPDAISFEAYRRYSGPFELESVPYRMQTVTNIPDFDQPGLALKQMASLLATVIGKVVKSKPLRTAVIGSGQGHLPVLLTKLAEQADLELQLDIISHDRLELLATSVNLSKSLEETDYRPPTRILQQTDIPDGPYDLILFNPGARTLPLEVRRLSEGLERAAAQDCRLISAGKSAEMTQYQKTLSDYSQVRVKKSRGYRALLLQMRKTNRPK